MKQVFFLLLIFFALLGLLPYPALAHVGSGPSFLKVNGNFVFSNSHYLLFPNSVIAMDLVLEPVQLNEPVRFDIDIENLPIPQELLGQARFRWQFEKEGDYSYGIEQTHAYTKPGSYVVTIEATYEADENFRLIDSVQLNVLPRADYTMPHVDIITNLQEAPLGQSVIFQAKVHSDSTATVNSYLWNFGDGDLSKVRSEEEYTFSSLPSARAILVYVIDSNNLSSYAIINALPLGDSIVFKPVTKVQTSEEVLPTSVGFIDKLPTMPVLILLFSSLVVIVASMFVFFRRSKMQ